MNDPRNNMLDAMWAQMHQVVANRARTSPPLEAQLTGICRACFKESRLPDRPWCGGCLLNARMEATMARFSRA